MNKAWIICIIITIVLGLSLGVGLAIYSFGSKTEGTEILSEKELADTTNSNIELEESNILNSVETSSAEDVISPNAIIIEKVYYNSCDHLKKVQKDIPEELVNKTEEEIEQIYGGWDIEKFSPTEIIVYKEMSGNCGEHYFVQNHNGVIGIYTVDEYGVKKLKEDTEISTQYLPEEDIQKLNAGVEIIGYTKLTEFLQDFE